MKFTRLLPLFLCALALLAPVLPAHADDSRTFPPGKWLDTTGAITAVDPTQSPATVFVFLNTECPIANKSIPELNRLAAEAQKKNIPFYGVLSDSQVTPAQAAKHSKDFAIQFPVIFDASAEIAAKLQPAVTPHAFVLDRKGAIAYSGRINDAFAAVGKPKAVITSNDLEDNMLAIAAGKPPAAAKTTPVGCLFESWKPPAKESKTPTVTYTRDIAPLVYANCYTCHCDGEVAPFTLATYKDTAKRAAMLAAVTESKQMPPWKAVEGFGKFHDERRLTPEQIKLFAAWSEAGAPEGDPKDLPPLPKFATGWQLGQPDLVAKMPKPYKVPAAGRDITAYVVVPLNLDEDKYLVGFEYKPGNRKVVHHMIALLDANGNARKLAKDRGDGNSYTSFGGPLFRPTGGVGGWVPGADPRLLPEGTGKPVKKNSDLVMQIHYHPSGKAEEDQGEIALYFAKKPIKQVALTFPLMNMRINIPPGKEDYTLTKSLTVPMDVTMFGISPHMHNIGREMKVTATLPDGTKKPLIFIDDWDWNWQGQYEYASPMKLPRGTKIDLWARFDNSEKNPRNPQNPPKPVRFGEQTTDEMCIAFLEFTVDGSRAPLLESAVGAADGETPNPDSQEDRAKAIREVLKQMREQRNNKPQ